MLIFLFREPANHSETSPDKEYNPGCFCPWTFFENIGFNTVLRTPLCHILLLNLDILQGSFRLCNWLSLRRLVSWINHLPPACWSTFRKSNSKQQLGCRFDIMDYESYFFVFWHMQLYMSWNIISFFGFTLLNILHFSSTLVLTFSYRRSLYTFYSTGFIRNILWEWRVCLVPQSLFGTL